MPELPEVETIVRRLASRLEGVELGAARLLFPPLLRRPTGKGLAVLEGKRILGIGRRGKMILISCEGGWTLVFHLKMTGRLLLARPGDPVEKHTRLIIPLTGPDPGKSLPARPPRSTANHLQVAEQSTGPARKQARPSVSRTGKGTHHLDLTQEHAPIAAPRDTIRELRFHDIRKFGFMCLLGPEGTNPPPELAGLGPEPLEASREDFAGRFRGRKGRLKSLLLDQRILAGIGNIYADEILFRARIHPLTSAAALGDEELETLRRSTRAVLERAIARKGSTIRDFTDPEGEPGDFQSLHKVYGREGRPCRACGTAIRRIRVSGRSTFFCPHCQRIRRAPK